MGEDQRKPGDRATLLVGGKQAPMNRFVESALVGVVEGFLSALSDIGPGEVQIVIPESRRRARTE